MDAEILRSIKDNLRQLEKMLGWEFGDQSECCGVTLSQRLVLMELGKKGGVSLIYLAQSLGLDPSTLSRTINGMVNIGLVSRISNPDDRRFVSLALTDQGQTVYENIEKLSTAYFEEVFHFIPQDKHGRIKESLSSLTEAIKKHKEQSECCREAKTSLELEESSDPKK